jgi:hypothetical protein
MILLDIDGNGEMQTGASTESTTPKRRARKEGLGQVPSPPNVMRCMKVVDRTGAVAGPRLGAGRVQLLIARVGLRHVATSRPASMPMLWALMIVVNDLRTLPVRWRRSGV